MRNKGDKMNNVTGITRSKCPIEGTVNLKEIVDVAAKRKEYHQRFLAKHPDYFKNLKHTRKRKASIKRYNASDAAKACRKRYLTPLKRSEIALWRREYQAELRAKVINLYTNGENSCRHCNGDVDNLHHTNPKAGKREKKKYGSNTTIAARLDQIKRYKKNPNYITPLCSECHLDEHKRLRALKNLKK